MKSLLDLDDFERVFSTFCALSYTANVFSFSPSKAKEFAEQSLSYNRLGGDPNDLISDLVECVCMLQYDGYDLSFVHRSFQEYFTAVFAISYHQTNIRELYEKIGRRDRDNTLAMVKEIDLPRFELEWLIPTLEKYIVTLESLVGADSILALAKFSIPALLGNDQGGVNGFLIGDPTFTSVLSQLVSLYPEESKKLRIGSMIGVLQEPEIRNALAIAGIASHPIIDFLEGVNEPDSDDGETDYVFANRDEVWLKHTKLRDWADEVRKSFNRLLTKSKRAQKVQAGIITLT